MTEYLWTSHVQFKMKYYGLSKQKVSGIIRRPDRIEKGIAGNGTIAVMQAVSPKIVDGKKVWKQEIWTMYQDKKRLNRKKKTVLEESGPIAKNETVARFSKLLNQTNVLKVISAWRYPGVSPKNNPIPDEVWRDMMNLGDI